MHKMSVYQATYALMLNSAIFLKFLLNICWYIKTKTVDYYYQQIINNNFEYVHKSAKTISKIPTHLTILLRNETPSYSDFANLVMWSAAAGIPFISFYDNKGVVKANEDVFETVVELESKKIKDVHILWQKNGNSLKNGYAGRKISVKTLSLEDGHQNIVSVTKTLAQNEDEGVNEDKVFSSLKSNYMFPDPDLGIYFGGEFKTDGYPPWQISGTEFLSIESQYNVSVHRFVDTLYRFSKIEQRFGK